MYISSEIATCIKQTAKKRGVTMKKLLADVGLGFNTMSNMKTSMIMADSLARIADYLGCSVDYLLGRDSFCKSDDANNGLLEKCNSLNSTGQEKAEQYIDDLLENPKYRRETSSSKKVIPTPTSSESAQEQDDLRLIADVQKSIEPKEDDDTTIL